MTFGDELWEAFEQMMLYREAVGYATATYRNSVPPFIDYCVRNYTDGQVVTQQMLEGWLAHYPYSANSRAAFVSLIREYTKYLHFLGRDDFIPDDDYSTKRIAFSPYLFTDEELHMLFAAFDGCTGATCGKRYFPETSSFLMTCLNYASDMIRWLVNGTGFFRNGMVGLTQHRGITRYSAGSGKRLVLRAAESPGHMI